MRSGTSMGEIKRWQIVLFVAAVVVLGGAVVWMVLGGEKVQFADKLYLVDVPTGEVFVADLGGRRGIAIPAMHPDTRARTLVPIQRSDNGDWAIGESYRPGIKDMKVSPAANIDSTTWAVSSVTTGSARAYKSPLAG